MGHLICSVRKRYPLLGSTSFILCTLYLLLIWPPHTAVAAVADTGCKFTKAGTSYSGSLTRTVGGITCQRWDSQTPHAHSYLSDSLFPDETKSDAANYCRNPDDQEPNGPWCYTMDQNTRWQYCDIPMCECRTTTGGHSYAGTLSTTQTGKRCQRWDSQVPHGHSYLDPTWFPEGNVSLANNYCRNPDGQWQAGLWCYTTDPNVRWETCDVPMCECKTTPDGMTYMGRIAQTTAGQTCQRWDSQTPHEHSYTDGSMYPDGNVSFAQNYCRNPDDNEPGGPWCYTTSSSPRWGYCTVPLCELHLRITTTVSTPTATPFTGPTPTVGWATERPDVDHQECKFNTKGTSYRGTQMRTVTGKTCQRWDTQSPHTHSYTDPAWFPDQLLLNASNYCRNPQGHEPTGPWCYTTDPNSRWELCSIQLCDCRQTRAGTEYMGHTTVTSGGIQCQRWDQMAPHRHSYTDPSMFPDNTLADAVNYCRNPERNEPNGPWCYTTDPRIRWQYCNITYCDCKVDNYGLTYQATKTKTAYGLTCQRWDSNTPQQHGYLDNSMFPDATVSDASNYCRNPDDQEPNGPWCYTMNPVVRWQYCDVLLCDMQWAVTTDTPTSTPLPNTVSVSVSVSVQRDCKVDQAGVDYGGTRAKTINGKTCQRWDSQTPHTHSYTDPSMYPDGTLSDAQNYCRNPDVHEPDGPWCYTTDANTRWEYCGVPLCSPLTSTMSPVTATPRPTQGPNECRTNDTGEGYMGKLSHTVNFKSCQAWSSNTPHNHKQYQDSDFPDGTVARAGSFCRNPSGEKPNGPWCYTKDPSVEWEYCSVPRCGCRKNKGGWGYNDTLAHSKTGKACQRWDSQSPHTHSYYDPSMFPDSSVSAAENFCRNPDRWEPEGPWCYTMDSNTRWEYCTVPFCECKLTDGGHEYGGKTSKTASGRTCQRWDQQAPHTHRYYDVCSFPEAKIEDASNYCRNPEQNEHSGPWCYTTDSQKRWEYCNIPKCPAGGFLPTSNPLPTAGRQISGESLSTGGIVGICLAIILVMTVAFVGFYMYRRYRWKPSLTDSDAVNGTNKSFDNPIYGTGIHFTGDKVVLCDDGPKSQDKA